LILSRKIDHSPNSVMTAKPNHQHRQLAKNAAGLPNSKCAGFYGSRAIGSLRGDGDGDAPPAKLI